MNRLGIVSRQIKNNETIYASKSLFEDIIITNKIQVIGWIENLIPINEQIKQLQKLGCENLQKRNYIRILTKLFPDKYSQFVSINILIRDIDCIVDINYVKDIEEQYYILINDNKLKFPGRHKKYVTLEAYEEFVDIYKIDIDEKLSTRHIIKKNINDIHKDDNPLEDITAKDLQIEDADDKKKDDNKTKNEIDTKKDNQKSTDWLKLLTE